MRWIAALAYGISEHLHVRFVWPATFAVLVAGGALFVGFGYLIINGG